MDECLAIVRRLLAGQAVTFHGRFFDLEEAVIAPAPAQQIPIIVGGPVLRGDQTRGPAW